MKLKSSVIVAAIAAAALTAAPAFAGDRSEKGDRVTFSYKKSDLQNQKRVEKLYEQINRRSSRLCFENRAAGLSEKRACKADLVNDFVSAIDDRRLTTVHTGKTSQDRYADSDR